jgi:hypothetical protein
VYSLITSLHGKDAEKDEGDDFSYWDAANGSPTILWCGHPQGKTDQTLNAWAAEARELLA